jgi:hypothetical protein
MQRETPRKRPSRSFARATGAWRRSPRLLQLVCCCLALGVLLMTGSARADAPMCDRAGASVEAPPDVPPARSGSLEELPCDLAEEITALLDEAVQQPRHHAFKELDTHHQRAWAVVFALDLGAPSQPALAPAREGLSPLRGHPRGVFRPPLAG